MPESTHLYALVNRFRFVRTVALTAFAAVSAAMPAWGDEAKLKAYGRHLARECTTCHRIDGIDNGIPSIVGWPPDSFAATIRFYRDGTRTNAAMVSVANSLTDKQIEALAMYFASVPKSTPKNALPPGQKGIEK